MAPIAFLHKHSALPRLPAPLLSAQSYSHHAAGAIICASTSAVVIFVRQKLKNGGCAFRAALTLT